jgi:hypothetical protein
VSGRARLLAMALAAALLAAPGVAEACAVCFSATEENRMAFLVTTGLLTVLPLAILGGIGLWLRRHLREMERHHDAARRAAGPGR